MSRMTEFQWFHKLHSGSTFRKRGFCWKLFWPHHINQHFVCKPMRIKMSNEKKKGIGNYNKLNHYFFFFFFLLTSFQLILFLSLEVYFIQQVQIRGRWYKQQADLNFFFACFLLQRKSKDNYNMSLIFLAVLICRFPRLSDPNLLMTL